MNCLALGGLFRLIQGRVTAAWVYSKQLLYRTGPAHRRYDIRLTVKGFPPEQCVKCIQNRHDYLPLVGAPAADRKLAVTVCLIQGRVTAACAYSKQLLYRTRPAHRRYDIRVIQRTVYAAKTCYLHSTWPVPKCLQGLDTSR